MSISVWPVWAVVPAALAVIVLAAVAAVVDSAIAPVGRRSLMTPVYESARLLRQRRRSTPAPDALLWRVGTSGPFVVALLMAVVIPFGGGVLSDLNVGIVWFNAMDVLLWALWWLAGWGANSMVALIGGYRFLAQALAYELPLMFALTAPAVAAASLSVTDVVAAQADQWFIVQMPVAALVFVGSVVAYSAWGPFSHPVAPDVAGGILAEPTGIDRLLVLAGRYALLGVGAAMAVALFLGGDSGPLLPGWLWSIVKTLGVVTLMVAMRRRLPVLRAEKLMTVAWTVVLPLVLLQVLVVAALAARGGSGGM